MLHNPSQDLQLKSLCAIRVGMYLYFKQILWVINDMKNLFIALNMIKGYLISSCDLFAILCTQSD
jgi:hypothetical protein